MIYIKFLSLFMLDQENSNINIFTISFRTIHSAKIIIINLINYFSDYAMTKSNLDLKYYKSNPFTYITLEKYSLDKFYGIMINIKASK